MKTLNYLLALSAFAAFAFTTPAENAEYTIDANQTTIVWTGAKVGGEHTGTISVKEGGFTFEDDQLTGGTFVIDMNTITNTDLEGEYNGKLVGHLKSDDFFGVATYPTSKVVIKSVVAQGPGKYKVVADLTIKETTKEIKFPATVEVNNGTVTAKADITIDRSEYDVRYGSGSFFDGLGDKVIYDDFSLAVTAVAK
ncbi:MAG: YceI family protein [Cyclobacteriaceae bacterium]